MRIDAIGVTSRDFEKTIGFYILLGFTFPGYMTTQKHIEATTKDGKVRFMIDSHELAAELLGTDPVPANHAMFAIACDSPTEVDAVAVKIKAAGYTVVKEPWDAFWGQRYTIVQDPDGYLVDVFADLAD